MNEIVKPVNIKYPNQAGNMTLNSNAIGPENTNLFESTIGMLNIAPLKISGQYKIVVDLEGKLWLDNYCGRRVAVDMTNAFLPQVSNFISSETEIVDLRLLRYGGFNGTASQQNHCFWHIPLYLGATKNTFGFEYPKFFVLTKQPNEHIDNVSTVFQNGAIERLVDLEKIGLHRIFDEIFAEEYFETPIWFNWEDSKLILFGQGINPARPAKQTIEIFDIQANQHYFDVVNNKILNYYQKYQMFFPKFLNLEFEFDIQSNKKFQFNNYFGYLSNYRSNQSDKPFSIDTVTSFDYNIYTKLKSFDTEIQYKPYLGYALKTLLENNPDYDYEFDKYLVNFGKFYIQEVNKQAPQISFDISDIIVNDTLTIYDMDDTPVFEYRIEAIDINKSSLYRTIINVINKCNKRSGKQFHFSLATTTDPNASVFTLICRNNSATDFDELYYVNFPWYWKISDRYDDQGNKNYFRGITEYDAWAVNQERFETNNYVVRIDNVDFKIIEYFQYNGLMICRFDKPVNITKLTLVEILQEKTEELIETSPILLYDTFSQVPTFSQFNQDSYCNNLITHFTKNWNNPDYTKEQYIALVERFKNRIKTNGEYLYIREDKNSNDLIQYPVIDVNNQLVVSKHGNKQMTMMFSTIGHTTHFSPNLLNVHYQNYIQNGNLDFEKPNDQYQFYWFLIHGIMPEYHKGTISELRYFWEDEFGNPEKPKITSRVISSLDKTSAETIFLGVKYQLPIEYLDYKFAVYLNPNNQDDIEMTYNFKVNRLEKTMYLEINKYIDFNDLIRGMGKNTDNPMLDLSFFYSARESFNDSSEFLYQSIRAGLIIGEDIKSTESVNFDKKIYIGKWYAKATDGKWYFCVKRNTIFPNSEFDHLKTGEDMPTVYIYSSLPFKGPDGVERIYQYQSAAIDIKNVKETSYDYLWCEDIQVRFFDTSTIFINVYNQLTGKYDRYQINKDTQELEIWEAKNPDGFFPLYEKYATTIIDNQTVQLTLLAPEETLSLKEYYFDYIVTSKNNNLNNTEQTRSAFYFNEFFMRKTMTDAQILDKFVSNVDLFSIYKDEKTPYQQDSIDLFDRNQIWKLIQDLLSSEVHIKSLDEDQVRYILSEFTIYPLIDYCKVNSIPIEYGDEYIKINPIQIDKNVTIWSLLKQEGTINSDNNTKLFLIDRQKTKYLPYFPIIDNIKDFQIQPFKYFDSIFTLFDNKFGNLMLGTGPGYNSDAIPTQVNGDINAVSLWDINSNLGLPNIVSSLFSVKDDIKITTKTMGSVIESQTVNYFELFQSCEFVNYDNIVIINENVIGHTGDNAEYIKLFDNNIIPYITKRYTEFVLTYYYYLAEVLNEFGERLDYTVDSFDKFVVHFKPQITYRADYKNLIFVFKRY